METVREFQMLYTSTTCSLLLKALLLSFELAGGILITSFFAGTILALVKTYLGKFLGRLVTAYVEIFRNTPILFWIFVCYIAMPFGNQYVRAASGMFFASTATICEIVRGGLNAIPHGQIEGGMSQGLNTFQIMYTIVLPQCLRSVVPNFINQIISVFKDTSFLGQVAIPEFLYSSRRILGTANKYTGHGIEARDAFIIFGVAALVYFVINLLLSSVLRKLHQNALTGRRTR